MTPKQRAMRRICLAEAGADFRALYKSAGFTTASAAKFLHVSERTLHNWESGRHPVPYAALKLMRIWARYELPGQAWSGWCLHSGKLWSPEGFAFAPHDSSWWSLLCRRADIGSKALKELAALKAKTAGLQASTELVESSRAAVQYVGDQTDSVAAIACVLVPVQGVRLVEQPRANLSRPSPAPVILDVPVTRPEVANIDHVTPLFSWSAILTNSSKNTSLALANGSL